MRAAWRWAFVGTMAPLGLAVGYGFGVLDRAPVSRPGVASRHAPAPPGRPAPSHGMPVSGPPRAAAPEVPAASQATRDDARDDLHPLLSREAVDRDLSSGIATNAAARELMQAARARLFADDDDGSVGACFDRFATPLPATLRLRLQLEATPRDVRVTDVRAPDLPLAVSDCIRDRLGTLAIERRSVDFVTSAATVELETALSFALDDD